MGAGIGADVKEALQEVGTPFTATHFDGTTVTGEKLDIESYPDNSSEFIRQFFGYATLFYDTSVISGDIISLTPTGTKYLVTHTLPEFFEGGVVENGVPLFRINVSGSIKRKGTRVRDAQYKLTNVFADVYTSVYGTLLDDLARSYSTEIGLFSTEELRKGVFIQSGYEVLPGDRFYVSATEYYKIEIIEVNRYENLKLCYLSEDTR